MDRLVLLSFDAEEFDLPLEYGRAISADDQIAVGGEGLRRTLDLLDGLHIQATFFMTVRLAAAFPDLTRRVAQQHELASHGCTHSGFDEGDLLRSRVALEQLGAAPVVGFRRPRLAPTDAHAIAAAGYRYNSSENPTWVPGRYNNLRRPRRPYFAGELLNIPASVTPLVRFPLFWLSFKNAPLWATRAAAGWTLAADDCLVLYFHPWELCDLERFGVPRWLRRWDGRAMAERLAAYLKWLAARARFATCGEFDRRVREGGWPRLAPPAPVARASFTASSPTPPGTA